MNVKLIFPIILVTVSSFASSEECSTTKMSNAAAVDCLEKKSEQLDREVQAKVDALIKERTPGPDDDYPGAKEVVPAIQQAQKSWLQYREDLCVNQIDVMFAGGSGAGIATLQCKIELSKQRLVSIEL